MIRSAMLSLRKGFRAENIFELRPNSPNSQVTSKILLAKMQLFSGEKH